MYALPETDDVSAQKLKQDASGAIIPSEAPDPLLTLTKDEKKYWQHVTVALKEVGLVHKTDAMLLTVVCKTFARWASAEKQLQDYMNIHGGSWMVKTPNGFEQPHQWYYVAQKLKRELLDWLPEAALTIPSFHKLVGERAAPHQGDMFGDPVAAHRNRKPNMRLVQSNGSQ